MKCIFWAEAHLPLLAENNRLPRIGRARKPYVTVRFWVGLSGFALGTNLNCRSCPCCLPRITKSSASGFTVFGAQCPTPPIPLFTLRGLPRDRTRAKNSGPSGSLLLSREDPSCSASCRFIPAHCNRLVSLTIATPDRASQHTLAQQSQDFCGILLTTCTNLPLLRQSNLLHQFREARVRAQRAESKVSLQTLHLEFPLAVGGIEPDECLVFIAEFGVEKSNFEWRCLAVLALLEPGFAAY
jgi:hypothetical protein